MCRSINLDPVRLYNIYIFWWGTHWIRRARLVSRLTLIRRLNGVSDSQPSIAVHNLGNRGAATTPRNSIQEHSYILRTILTAKIRYGFFGCLPDYIPSQSCHSHGSASPIQGRYSRQSIITAKEAIRNRRTSIPASPPLSFIDKDRSVLNY